MSYQLRIGSASYKKALHLRPRRSPLESAKRSLLCQWRQPARPVCILWAVLSALTGLICVFCLTQPAWFALSTRHSLPAIHRNPPITGHTRHQPHLLQHLVHHTRNTPSPPHLVQINIGPVRYCKLFLTDDRMATSRFSSNDDAFLVDNMAIMSPHSTVHQTCYTQVLPDQFPFSTNFWTKTCLLYGNGTLILCLSTFVAIASMGYDLKTAKTLARRTAKLQGVAIFLLIVSLSIFPFVLPPMVIDPVQQPNEGSPRIPSTFSHKSSSSSPRSQIPHHFQSKNRYFVNPPSPSSPMTSPTDNKYANELSSSYQTGWAYTLAVMSTLLSVFCPFLAHHATLQITDTATSTGHHTRCPTEDADTLDVNGNFV